MPPKTKMTPEQVAAQLERPIVNPKREHTPLEERRNRDLTKGIKRAEHEKDTR
jgi:hypothetical protein